MLACSQPARLRRLLEQAARQTLPPVEALVVWNGRAALGDLVVPGLHVRVLTIPPEAFGHGTTRTFALEQVRTELVTLVSDDAFPVDEGWHASLVAPFAADPGLGAVYGRQIAGDDATPAERAFRSARYPADGFPIALGPGRTIDLTKLPISNANAAYRVAPLRAAGGFVPDLLSGEDVAAALTLLDAGWRVAYAGAAAVYHAHNYPFFEQLRRTFDAATSLRDIRRRFDVRAPTGRPSHAALAAAILSGRGGDGAGRAAVAADVLARALGVALAGAGRWMPRRLVALISRQRWYYRRAAGAAERA
ncbi:MAG TPA: glycosyltransferase [Gemmatimonadales bacterium]|nr:glycosyltransferase [Gemmatimonadales bacterium]